MPSVMVYIKQSDYDKWLAIEKKSAWLHLHLNDKTAVPSTAALDTSKMKSVEAEDTVVVIPAELTPKFCKNGHPIPYPKTKCMGKGCKYS